MKSGSTKVGPGQMVHLSVQEARQITEQALQKVGLSGEDLKIVVDHLVDAGLCGYEFLSLPRILTLVQEIRKRPEPGPIRIIRETPFSAVMDGANNCGCLAVFRAMEVAIQKAKTQGIAIVGIHNSFLSGRSGHYVEHMAREGLVGIHWASADPKVAPLGGVRRALGTNPIAFGIPTPNGPFVFDIGTSALMWGQVELAERTGTALPPGSAIDSYGVETTSAREAMEGALLPFGGHKGFGLSLVVQMLGLLSGNFEDRGQVADYGFVHLAINPGLMMERDAFIRQMGALIRQIKATKPVNGTAEIRLPGERSQKERERRLKDGLDFSETILTAIKAL